MKLLLSISLLFPVIAIAQNGIKPPATPQFQTFQPIDITRPSTLNNGFGQRQPSITPPSPLAGTVPLFGQGNGQPMGATADDIQRQVMQNQQRMIGVRVPGQEAQYAAERAKEYQEMMTELHQYIPPTFASMKGRKGWDNNMDAATVKAGFYSSLQQLKTMLASNRPSLSTALYITENAFGKPWLTQDECNAILDRSAAFIKTWLVQNGYKTTDNDALQMGIQKFMSEKLTVKQGQKTVTHQLFFYDFDDFKGDKDYRNTFMTKCLATGTGQCACMPLVYLALAERLGARAYLTFAPHHTFVKYIDNKGHIQNYEPTSNWNISDQWYQDNMFISQQAMRSGIYLDTLNTRQIIANCIVDLATEYIYATPPDDDQFLIECMKAADTYFPRHNNIYFYFVYDCYLKDQLRHYLKKNNLKETDDLKQFPDADYLQNAYRKNEQWLYGLGYRPQPENLYETILQEHEFKGKVQAGKNIVTKEKHNLFTNQ